MKSEPSCPQALKHGHGRHSPRRVRHAHVRARARAHTRRRPQTRIRRPPRPARQQADAAIPTSRCRCCGRRARRVAPRSRPPDEARTIETPPGHTDVPADDTWCQRCPSRPCRPRTGRTGAGFPAPRTAPIRRPTSTPSPPRSPGCPAVASGNAAAFAMSTASLAPAWTTWGQPAPRRHAPMDATHGKKRKASP